MNFNVKIKIIIYLFFFFIRTIVFDEVNFEYFDEYDILVIFLE